MSFLDYFKRNQKTAGVAKDRLQIIVARERSSTRGAPDYLPQLQQELLQVIAKYELIDVGQVAVNIGQSGGCDVLELSIVLSEKRGGPPVPPSPASPRPYASS